MMRMHLSLAPQGFMLKSTQQMNKLWKEYMYIYTVVKQNMRNTGYMKTENINPLISIGAETSKKNFNLFFRKFQFLSVLMITLIWPSQNIPVEIDQCHSCWCLGFMCHRAQNPWYWLSIYSPDLWGWFQMIKLFLIWDEGKTNSRSNNINCRLPATWKCTVSFPN